MSQSTRIFAVLGDACLRAHLQQQWRNNGLALCGLHAESGSALVAELGRLRPDVVVIDVEVDGAREFIESAAKNMGFPVVALVRSDQSASVTFGPLEWGATSVLASDNFAIETFVSELEAGVVDVCNAQFVDLLESSFPLTGAFPSSTVFDLRRALRNVDLGAKIVVIAAGTGGPTGVRRILSEMQNAPVSPIIYTQAATQRLVDPLVSWLRLHCAYEVMRVQDGAALEIGCVYVSSALDEVVRVRNQGGKSVLSVSRPEATSTSAGHVSSHFDVLFESVAETYGSRSVGILLSGRGEDGVDGLVAMRQAGSFTIVQDRASSIVYELPGQARDAGGAVECLPINEIGARMRMLMRPEHASQA